MSSSLPGYEEISTDILIIGAGGRRPACGNQRGAAGAQSIGNLQVASG